MSDYYSVIKMSQKVYAVPFDDLDFETEYILEHVDNGNAVAIVDDLGTAAELFECKEKDIEIVERD